MEFTYYDGLRDAIRALAVYRNGEQLVGVMQRPLKTVLAEIDTYEADGRVWP